MESSVKILFEFYSSALENWTAETMWAEAIDIKKGYYKIDNIPFYAPFACGDLIFAEFDENHAMLTYRETIKYSGNSTIQIILMGSKAKIDELRNVFETLKCETEQLNDAYFVINVPKTINYTPIKLKIRELEQQGMIGFAESCLDDRHSSKL